MYQIKVNDVLLGTVYFTMGEAMDACAEYKKCSAAVFTEIIFIHN